MAGLTKWSPESHRRPWQRRHSSVEQHGDEPEGEGEGRGDGVEHWLTTVTNAWSEKAEEDRSSGEVAAEPRPWLEKERTAARTSGTPARFLARGG